MIMEEKTPGNNFGYSVSISGKYAIVGAPFEDEDKSGLNTIPDAGAAYIFYNDGSKWSQIRKITATTRWANDHFGQSVSINGKYAVVGAPQANMNGIEEGYLEMQVLPIFSIWIRAELVNGGKSKKSPHLIAIQMTCSEHQFQWVKM